MVPGADRPLPWNNVLPQCCPRTCSCFPGHQQHDSCVSVPFPPEQINVPLRTNLNLVHSLIMSQLFQPTSASCRCEGEPVSHMGGCGRVSKLGPNRIMSVPQTEPQWWRYQEHRRIVDSQNSLAWWFSKYGLRDCQGAGSQSYPRLVGPESLGQ